MTTTSAVHEALALWGNSPTAMANALNAALGTTAIKRQNISHWLTAGRVPAEHAPTVEAATRLLGQAITCERLCPGVQWDVVRSNAAAKPGKARKPVTA